MQNHCRLFILRQGLAVWLRWPQTLKSPASILWVLGSAVYSYAKLEDHISQFPPPPHTLWRYQKSNTVQFLTLLEVRGPTQTRWTKVTVRAGASGEGRNYCVLPFPASGSLWHSTAYISLHLQANNGYLNLPHDTASNSLPIRMVVVTLGLPR